MKMTYEMMKELCHYYAARKDNPKILGFSYIICFCFCLPEPLLGLPVWESFIMRPLQILSSFFCLLLLFIIIFFVFLGFVTPITCRLFKPCHY